LLLLVVVVVVRGGGGVGVIPVVVIIMVIDCCLVVVHIDAFIICLWVENGLIISSSSHLHQCRNNEYWSNILQSVE
jgi:hypothetical protein